MKYVFNLAAIFLIFSFIYSPLFSSDALAFASFYSGLLKKYPSYYGFKNDKSKNSSLSSVGLPIVSDGEINIQSDAPSYSETIVNALKNTGFSAEDLKSLKKNSDKRPLSAEELAKDAEILGVAGDIKKSLEIWQKLDEKMIDSLKNEPINAKSSQNHKSILAWYKYHANYIKSLMNPDLTRADIKKINENHWKNIKYYVPRVQKQMADAFDARLPIAQFLIKSVEAIGLPFGGRIISYTDFDCIFGIPFIVAGAKGGWFFLYYAVWAANPFLYKAIHPGAAILGKYSPTPGICTKATSLGLFSYPAGLTILYFGTSP